MRHSFRSTLLLTFTAISLASCELIPDEFLDILNPKPKPEPSCELTTIHQAGNQPDQFLTLTIDSTGANEVTFIEKYRVNGQEVKYGGLITPNPSDADFWDVVSSDQKGLTSREVTVDAQKRLSRVAYFYNGSSPDGNLAATITTYNYDEENIVKATTLEMEGNDTTTYNTTFEYSSTGNLMKVVKGDMAISYEYGNMDNKLYNFQQRYAGFDLFSPLSYNTEMTVEAPLPSKKLPSKLIFETNSIATVDYTWTLNDNGFPTKLQQFDERSQETSTFEYGYVNCETH